MSESERIPFRKSAEFGEILKSSLFVLEEHQRFQKLKDLVHFSTFTNSAIESENINAFSAFVTPIPQIFQ